MEASLLLDDILNLIENRESLIIEGVCELLKKKKKMKMVKSMRLEELKLEVQELDDEIFILEERKKKLVENTKLKELLKLFE